MLKPYNINIVCAVAASSLFLGACVSTQVMPLAPNAVRIDTRASGLLYHGRAVPETMIAAAKETLARGYTHFRFADASMGQGSEVVGATSWGSGQANAYGNSLNYSGSGLTTVDRRNVEGAAVTVLMFRSNEAGARNAFDARSILSQYR